jgi:glutathione synthase/RimK-type ligase-like ATP-grasp enzyme
MIAIHFQNKIQDKTSEQWLIYLKENNIPVKIVNCFDSNIISQLKGCSGLMFHISLGPQENMLLFAKQLVKAIENKGIKVFPNSNTMWHYDDKVGQKYLFESIEAPLVPTYVFFSLNDAANWIKSTNFPKVFKLRNGASSKNVMLLKTEKEALKLVEKAFGKGFKNQGFSLDYLKEKWRLYKIDKTKLAGVKGAVKRLFFVPKEERKYSIEQGYAYFQEFIPNNTYDIRIVVINHKAYGFRRKVRKNDFRASGSGEFDFKKDSFPIDCIKIGFDVSNKLNLQSAAFDFVLDKENNPLIVEVSYTFASSGKYRNCEGYWDKQLNWYPGPFNPYGWMVESLISEIQYSET